MSKKVKKLISCVLIVALIFQLTGCYSFNKMKLDINYSSFINGLDEKDIRIELKNGVIIDSKAYNHTYNNLVADLILGKGTLYSFEKNKIETFGGKIYKKEIDSMLFINNFLKIWLKNKDFVVFERTKYLEAEANTSKGLLIFDNMQLNCVPEEEIQSIEVSEYNPALTTVTIIGVVVVIVGLVVFTSLPYFFANN